MEDRKRVQDESGCDVIENGYRKEKRKRRRTDREQKSRG